MEKLTLMENFIKTILDDSQKGCAGGLLFITLLTVCVIVTVCKEKLQPITEPIKTRIYTYINGKIDGYRVRKNQKELQAAYKLVKKDLHKKKNQYKNLVWNTLASTYQEN